MSKNSLVANINRRKRLGISRSKKKSTISDKAYAAMKRNWKNYLIVSIQIVLWDWHELKKTIHLKYIR